MQGYREIFKNLEKYPLKKQKAKPGTKWTQRGDLYIFPTTIRQKELLLKQKCVSGYQISSSLCKTEQEVRGVVYNVPPNNTEEVLLSNQGVFKVKRFTNIGLNNSTNTLPMHHYTMLVQLQL